MKRQHKSVFLLMVRSSLYPVLGVLALTVSVECGLLAWAWHNAADIPLEMVLRESHVELACLLGLIGMSVFLCRTGCEFDSKVGYTLSRLSVGPGWQLLWQTTYNACCYVLFWSAQVVLMYGFCVWFMEHAGDGYASNQVVMLAFYRSDFLHSLLPMESVARWVRNVVLLVCLSLCAAAAPVKQRRARQKQRKIDSLEIMFMYIVIIPRFPAELGAKMHDVTTIGISLIITAMAVVQALGGKEDGDEISEREQTEMQTD